MIKLVTRKEEKSKKQEHETYEGAAAIGSQLVVIKLNKNRTQYSTLSKVGF